MNIKHIFILILFTALFSSILSGQTKKEESGSLKMAYKKEFAFLEAQKRALAQRLEELKREREKKVNGAQKEISDLQNEFLSLTMKSERLSDMLVEAERSADITQEGIDILQSTLDQARSSLRKYGIAVPDTPENKSEIDEILNDAFLSAASTISDLGKLRTTEGEFFLRDGKVAKGSILKIGDIASYAKGDLDSGLLAPAGEGKMKLWNVYGTDIANQLFAKEKPAELKIFLYESTETEITEREGKTVLGVIQSGGVIAWVIVFMGMIVLFLIALRTLFLHQSSANTAKLMRKMSPLVEKGELTSAIELCRQNSGATTRVLAATLRNIGGCCNDHVEDIISESILHENTYLDRFGSIILVFAAVAPLMGLLGTVTGMISTFDVITEFGTGDPKMLSGGISEALVTTELGLIVAIPALFIGNLLSNWAENIKRDMEQAALHVINIYEKYKMGKNS